MVRLVAVMALVWSSVCWCGLGRADDASDLQNALALQKVMQKAIRDVEPAIACILVSRSDLYQRLRLASSAEYPGQLGGVDPSVIDVRLSAVTEKQRLTEKQRTATRKQLDLADPGHVPQSFGSGVVIDAKGLILTNYHVVRGASKVFVRLPGGKGSYADIHAADPRSDLAVLSLLNAQAGLKAIVLGDSSTCKRGQFVMSIANPYAAGFRDGQPSASWGILSNIRRRAPAKVREEDRNKTLHHYGTLLQTDVRLNLGCSGGALINLQGEMIGLTTALAGIHGGETPGGFAVPIDTAMLRIIDVLKRGEEVDYGFLGVAFNEPAGGRHGVVLSHVTPGSPAQREGELRINDAILEVNGIPVKESDDVFLALGTQLAGSRVKIKVLPARGGKVIVKEVELAKFYVPGKSIASSPGQRPFFRGLRVDYTSLLALKEPRHVSIIPPGVMVCEVQPNSPAATAQLKEGEIITQVNGRQVFKPADFYREVAALRAAVELTLFNLHGPPPKVILHP